MTEGLPSYLKFLYQKFPALTRLVGPAFLHNDIVKLMNTSRLTHLFLLYSASSKIFFVYKFCYIHDGQTLINLDATKIFIIAAIYSSMLRDSNARHSIHVHSTQYINNIQYIFKASASASHYPPDGTTVTNSISSVTSRFWYLVQEHSCHTISSYNYIINEILQSYFRNI